MVEPITKFLSNSWITNCDKDKFVSAIKNFNINEICNEKIVTAFAIFGFFMAARMFSRPMEFTYRQFFRPRFDLYSRYGGGWAMVTGASSGMGKAYCLEFARLGFNIVMVSRSQTNMEAAKKELNEKYPKTQVKIVEFDFGDLATEEGA